LENDLKEIRNRVEKQAEMVEQAVANAIHALQTGNKKLAYATILDDLPINRTMRAIDSSCHKFIATHLPSGGHLRLLSSVIRVNIELERIGDYAVTIARESAQLSSPPEGGMARELDRMASETMLMLSQSIRAFNDLNAEMGRNTKLLAEQMESNLDSIYTEMMSNQDRGKVKDIVAVFVVFTQLKRVADQAKNLCEDAIFAVTGEQKAPKVYKILFIDEDNGCKSQMAEAIARRNYPDSGEYLSAGRQPAASLNPDLADFLENRGQTLSDVKLSALDSLTERTISEQHVIVSLEGEVASYLPNIPFHSTALEWDLGPVPEAGSEQGFANLYRAISLQVKDLMELLRGEGAS
jgi:phosphate transport system protein